MNTVGKARLFTAEFSQLSIFIADCLRHPIEMAGIETVWELHTLIVMKSWLAIFLHSCPRHLGSRVGGSHVWGAFTSFNPLISLPPEAPGLH